MNETHPEPKLKPLSRRQALKVKRKHIRGRINKLRSELDQLLPVLAKLEAQLIETHPIS